MMVAEELRDMVRPRTHLQAEQRGSARAGESKADSKVSAGRMQLLITKMGEIMGGAALGRCGGHKDLCFRHVKFEMSSSQGS